MLGNTIYNNENFLSPLPIPGLGINLVTGEGLGYGVLGVDPQDPTQPDNGPNGLQNSPVLTTAAAEAGSLTISGSLHGLKNTNYTLEVFADERQNPFGAGEGQTLLGRISVTTDASGNVAFSSSFAEPGTGYRYVSSTATTVPGGGEPGVSSEFSVNAPITTPGASAPSTPTTTTPATSTPSTTTPPTTATPKGASTTTVNASGSSATASGESVTLPAQASCSSATASPCTVTTTAAVSAASATKTSVTATTASATKRKHAKPPLVIGHSTMTLAPGANPAASDSHRPRPRATALPSHPRDHSHRHDRRSRAAHDHSHAPLPVEVQASGEEEDQAPLSSLGI